MLIIFLVAGCSHDENNEVSLSAEKPLDNEQSLNPEIPSEDGSWARYAAKILSLETNGEINLNEDNYNLIYDQLIVLESTYSEIRDTYVRPSWALDRLLVKLDPEADSNYKIGNYTEWDQTNEKYSLSIISDSSFWYMLVFNSEYNTRLLSEVYKSIPGILWVSPDSAFGDGTDICLEKKGDSNLYIFDLASGDCEAGCISHTYHSYIIDNAFNSEKIGTYVKREDEIPEWFEESKECKKNL